MNIRDFTPADYPALVSVHASLDIPWPEQPRSAEGWAEIDRTRNPRCKNRRWAAEAGGAVVGIGRYWQSNFDYQPQRFYVSVEVRPEQQRQGIGAALYERVWEALQPFDPLVLRADAFTNLPQGLRFLQQRGFYEAFRETPVWLDIPSFDPTPYAGLEDRLREQGIVIKTLREMAGDPQRDHKLFEVYWEGVEDLPQEEPRLEKPSFEEWLGWSVNEPTILPDAYFIAMRGEEYVGLRELGRDPGNDTLAGGLLAVKRAYRKQRIGLAMQLRGIAYAQQHGYAQLKTCTAVQNAPMQALFDKLGYHRGPQWIQCQKDIRK